MKKKQARILFYDIETFPLLGYAWDKWDTNLIYIVKEWEIASFAYRWSDEKTIHCVARPDFKDKTDKSITQALQKLLNTADITCAHNGDKFDLKKVNTKIVGHRIERPVPAPSVDTLKVAKKHFKFTSNSLNDLAEYLGVGKKVPTGGIKLWIDCMAGDAAAWKRMVRYNKMDVQLLQDVYKVLLPWIDNHPHMGRIEGRPDACPNCGSDKLHGHGVRHTRGGSYQRFRCGDCGTYVNSTKKAK